MITNASSPKLKKLLDAMEDIFGTVLAPVREVKVWEPTKPEWGADEKGAYCKHEIHLIVKIDSRADAPGDGRPPPLPVSSKGVKET